MFPKLIERVKELKLELSKYKVSKGQENDNFPRIKCDQCLVKCLNVGILEFHMKSEHKFKCGMCKSAFQTRPKLITHMNLAHQQMKKSFKVKGNEMIKRYIKQISNGESPECPMCKFIFKDLEDLKDHMAISCTDCNSCIKRLYPKLDWPLPEEDHCPTQRRSGAHHHPQPHLIGYLSYS